MVVIPEPRPAASAFGAERDRTITSPPPLNHNPAKARVIRAMVMATARRSSTFSRTVPTAIPATNPGNSSFRSGFDHVFGRQ